MSESFEIPIAAGSLPGDAGAARRRAGRRQDGRHTAAGVFEEQLLAPEQIFATVQMTERAKALSVQSGVEVTTDDLAAAQQADVILLGVKPIQVPALIEESSFALNAEQGGTVFRGFSEDAQY